MKASRARIPPLPPSEWKPEVLEALATLGRRDEARSEPRDGPRVVNALAVLAHYPELAKAFLTFNQHILFATSLSDRVRELVILRIGWLCECEYEWAQHVLLGREAGLTDEEIERIKRGPDAEGWDSADALLLRAVDELHAGSFISDACWDELEGHLDTRELMDLVFTIGVYQLLAGVFNSLGIPLDPGLEP